MNSSCILLNGDYTFLCLVDWKKAMGLVFAEKVKALKQSAVHDILIKPGIYSTKA